MDKDEWSKVKEFVKSNIGESAHTNWIQPIELKEIKGTVAKFKVPTRFIGTWVHRNYGDHIIQGFKNQKLSIDRLEFIASSVKRSDKKNGSEKSAQKKSLRLRITEAKPSFRKSNYFQQVTTLRLQKKDSTLFYTCIRMAKSE